MIQRLKCSCPKLTVARIEEVENNGLRIRTYTCTCSINPNLFEEAAS